MATLHQTRTHPVPVDGCDLCRWSSISIGGSALPTRRPGVSTTAATEARWDKDIPAYRSLRKEGLQPRGVDGAHELMTTAKTDLEVEGKPALWKDRHEILSGSLPKNAEVAA